jgi:hypothetical protein
MAGSEDVCVSAVKHAALVFRMSRFGLSGFASRDIGCDATLLSLPHSSMLTEAVAASSATGRLVISSLAPAPPELTGRALLYIFMVDARARGNDARFSAYLRALPTHFDDPLWWSADAVVARLKSTNLAAAVAHRARWLRRIFDAVVAPLTAARPADFPASIFSFRAWMWAHSCFSSRGFPARLALPPSSDDTADDGASRVVNVDGAGGVADGDDANPLASADGSPVGCMLPMLDILNHSPAARVEWTRGARYVAFIARESIREGHEVFNNYGPKGNEELLLAFGFVVRENAAESVALALAIDWSRELDVDSACARALAATTGIGAGGAPTRFVIARDGIAPPPLVASLRLLLANDRERTELALAAADSPSALKSALFSPLRAKDESRVFCALRDMLEAKIASLEGAHGGVIGARVGAGSGGVGVVEAPCGSASSLQLFSGNDERKGGVGGADLGVDDAWPCAETAAQTVYRDACAREYVAGQLCVLQAARDHALARIEVLKSEREPKRRRRE